jgi:hypothetical protein
MLQHNHYHHFVLQASSKNGEVIIVGWQHEPILMMECHQ